MTPVRFYTRTSLKELILNIISELDFVASDEQCILQLTIQVSWLSLIIYQLNYKLRYKWLAESLEIKTKQDSLFSSEALLIIAIYVSFHLNCQSKDIRWIK